MKALFFFAPLFRARLRGFSLALLLSLITIAAGTALLGVSGWFLTATALTALGVSFNLFAPSAAVRGFSFIRILSRYFEKLIGHNTTLALLSDVRRFLFERLFPRVPLPARSLRHGDLVSRLTADVDALDTLFLLAIGPLIAALVIGAIVAAVLFAVLPVAGWIYLAALLAAAIAIPLALVIQTDRTGTALVEAAAILRTHVLDATLGHDDIVLFGQQDVVRARFTAAGNTLSRLRKRQSLATAIASGAVQTLTGFVLIAILYFGLVALETGTLDGPILAAIVFGVMGSFEATATIVRSVGKFSAAAASAARLHEIATMPPPIREAQRPVPLPKGTDIAFKSVSFAYPDGTKVLQHLDLDIASGEHVAITGISGSGKSTLLNLLLRIEDVREGAIEIAGTDIRDVALEELYTRVALLSQDSPVFLDTIRNNLLLARTDASDADLWTALRTARLEPFVRGLPSGLDTLVGETGTTLSVGQARRLCLARTVLAPAGIVVLDEPTSGLDAETEAAFLADIPGTFRGRTLLLVTHAQIPENARMRMLVLTNGQLMEPKQ
ncbi:thiol reductant ABC exporter subunit CydC [Pelagibacterium limicola]|uniref:thiol reductant ABC exporter subunit CydC n=1 Tax=Pelagibacterium limicola TaxID=2791022 RepID=UPI0018B008F3|nr:thiol reductant ABC exporter subunit CydC [Pelagibacterium limicola]